MKNYQKYRIEGGGWGGGENGGSDKAVTLVAPREGALYVPFNAVFAGLKNERTKIVTTGPAVPCQGETKINKTQISPPSQSGNLSQPGQHCYI